MNAHKKASTLDLALRAARSGLITCVIEMHPGEEPYGEFSVPDDLLARLIVFPVLRDNTGWDEGAGAVRGLELARFAMACGRYDLVILDEVPKALSKWHVRMDEIQRLADSGTKTRLIVIGMSAGNGGLRRSNPRKHRNDEESMQQHGRTRNNIVREEI